MIFQNNIVPDRKTGSLPDPELPKTGLQERGGKGPGPPCFGKKSQLEPSRDGENVRRDRQEPILDERWRRTAANRVRRLLPLIMNDLKREGDLQY
jgi:hypothetical protein